MRVKRIFVLFIFIFSLQVFAELDLELFVQPYKNTEFFADEKKLDPQFILKDNSLAKIKLKLDNNTKILKIKNSEFKTLELNRNSFLKKNNFIVLQKLNSNYKTVQVFNTGVQPKSLVFVNEKTIAVPLLKDSGIDIINIETGDKKRITPPSHFAKKQGFVESLVLEHKNELWVSQMTTGSIHIFDLVSLEYKTTIKSSGAWGKVMAYNPKTNRVYLSNWTSHDISVINPDKKIEERKIKTKAVPRGMAFSEDGKFIYCAQFEDASGNSRCKLLKKRLSDFKTIAERGKFGAKRHIVTDYKKNRYYVSDMLNGTVEVYSLKDDSLIASIPVFSHPNTIALNPDGSRLFVSCRGPNNPTKGYLYKGLVMGRLDVIDTEKLERIESIEAGNQPTGLAVSPDGKKIVLSDFLDNRIRVLEKQD